MNVVSMVISPGISMAESGDFLSSTGPGFLGIPVIRDYSHELGLFGHYLTANASWDILTSEVDYYRELTPGKLVKFYSDKGEMIWTGLINEITISGESGDVIIGPWTEIANHVAISYQGMTYTAGGVSYSEGDQTTEWAIDTDSWVQYGRLESVISGSRYYFDVEAERMALVYLNEISKPKVKRVISLGQRQGQTQTISNKCVGAVELLRKSYWSDPRGPEWTTPIQKLRWLIDDTKNDTYLRDSNLLRTWFPIVYSELPGVPLVSGVGFNPDFNRVLGFEEDEQLVYDIIAGDLKTVERSYAYAAYGLSTVKWPGLADSVAWLMAEPGSIGYKFNMPDRYSYYMGTGGRVFDAIGAPAREESIQVGEFIWVDGRAHLIESVSYTLGSGVNINHSIRGVLSRALSESTY